MSQRKRVYLDHAATSWPKSDAVIEAMNHYVQSCGAAAGRGAYHAAAEADGIVSVVRRDIAALIGAADAGSISLHSNGTAALNAGIHGLLREGDHVVVTAAEHNSVLRPLQHLSEQQRIELTILPVDGDGVADAFDNQNDTPKGVVVDGSGVPLDVDMDGVYDYQYEDLFTVKNAKVNVKGVEVDSDRDGVPDSRDLEKSAKNALVNYQGITVNKPNSNDVSGVTILPSLFVNTSSADIRQEDFKRLALAARIMRDNPKEYKILDELTEYAINYFKDKVEPNKKFKKPNLIEKKALENLILKLNQLDQSLKPEEIQTHVYTVGKENGYEKNLRDWFKLIYQVVFGEENGPRIGFFISFFGLNETIKLISDKIK